MELNICGTYVEKNRYSFNVENVCFIIIKPQKTADGNPLCFIIKDLQSIKNKRNL